MRAEISQVEGRSVGLIALDLVKCYEYVMHHILGVQCILHECPLYELRATLISYGWKRHLVLGAVLAAGLEAWKGIIAGCVAATMQLKGYMVDTLSMIVYRNPATQVDTWVDDITLESHADDDHELEIVVTKVTLDTQQLT